MKSKQNSVEQSVPGTLTRREMLSLLALAGGGMLIGCAINPVTGQSQLFLMSPEQELAIDKQHAPDQISQDYGLVQDKTLQKYVTWCRQQAR